MQTVLGAARGKPNRPGTFSAWGQGHWLELSCVLCPCNSLSSSLTLHRAGDEEHQELRGFI